LLLNLSNSIGKAVYGFIENLGYYGRMLAETLYWTFRPPTEIGNILKQIEEVGVKSLPVVLITAAFTGMVLALQSWSGFARFQAESLVGTVVALSMTRELGPVLVVPRVIATTIVMPILVIFGDLVGIVGGYFVSVNVLGGNPVIYIKKTYQYLELNDIYIGLLKAAVFGLLIALISCSQGFLTEGGAEGVGKSTTRAVVYSAMTVLISDYFLTALLF
jgi:phospholipid/cholesterol/gamma-HCH transport system permease protein